MEAGLIFDTLGNTKKLGLAFVCFYWKVLFYKNRFCGKPDSMTDLETQ